MSHNGFEDHIDTPIPKLVSDGQQEMADAIRAHQSLLNDAMTALADEAGAMAAAGDWMVSTIRDGGKLLIVGNGGSAALAQHFATELVGRFKRTREPYAAIALTADTAVLTAISNDFGYEQVFARQVAAFGRSGDLLIAFSTSGESANVLSAATAAREAGIRVIAVTAESSSSLQRIADLTLRAPVSDTPTAQELHLMLTHIFCDVIESQLAIEPAQEVAAL